MKRIGMLLVQYSIELVCLVSAGLLFANGGTAFGLAFLAIFCLSLGFRALHRTNGAG